MRKFCPLSMSAERSLVDCGDRCMLYDWERGGCLIKKALTTYIDEHKPIRASSFKPYDKDDPMEGLRLVP